MFPPFQEALRLYPPAGNTFRKVCTDGLHIAGYHVPKGAPVMVSVSQHPQAFKAHTAVG